MTNELEHQLEVKRVETLYAQTTSAIAANLFTAALFAVVLGVSGYTKSALAWLVAVVVVLAARYASLRAFERAQRDSLVPTDWFRRYGIGIACSGVLWGAMGAYAISLPVEALDFLTITILVGMVGGSVATCSVSVPVFLAFTLPSLLPPAAVLLIGGDTLGMTFLGVLLLLYIGVVTRSVVQVRGVIVQSLFHRFENKRLLGVLETETQQIQASEQQLRAAYDDLEQTHRALVEQRSLVDQERVVSARLREIDRLKDEFLTNTSHELRTPLYGIVGLAESMVAGSAGTVSDEVRANLGMIIASGQRLSHLVGDILDFSKLRHASLELERRAVPLAPLVEVVSTLSRPLVGSKDLRLSNGVSDDLPPVDADENRLQQILHNLIGNAVKFTEQGRVEITAAREGDQLVITVADTGVGIAQDEQERIFDAFVQADASIERAFGGTGLGLAVTRQLVELHGGRIWVESTPGTGARFSFSLPLADATTSRSPTVASIRGEAARPASAEAIQPVPAPAPQPSEHDRARILVVDDEPVNRMVLQSYLKVERFDVSLASSGDEALRLLQDERFDLVLLDVMMPRVSGYEVCRVLRERHPLAELPVVFLTARSQDADVVAGLALGANDYLSKPISRDRLLARIRPHLDLLRVHRDLEGVVAEKMSEVKVLEGLLPICAGCKKIRDDDGDWQQLEAFIDDHSEARFSHGFCPDCFDSYTVS